MRIQQQVIVWKIITSRIVSFVKSVSQFLTFFVTFK